jgi:hypothetical protein
MANDHCEIAIVGAGPYGLGLAAHLREAKIATRVFGDPMAFWRRNMPSGMKLRSPWRASHIPDVAEAYSLDRFATEHAIPRSENLPLADFVRYGEWFARHAVPDLDPRLVKSVSHGPRGFRVTLADGDTVDAKRVVIAMGLHNQAYRPARFEGISRDFVSHSSDMVNPADYRGKHVAVVGRGQSAVESAVLLGEAGAQVDLIARGDVRWLGSDLGDQRPKSGLRWQLREMLEAPSAIGPLPYSWLVDMPDLMYSLPPGLRDFFSVKALRPAASAWLKPRAQGVRIDAGRAIVDAEPRVDGKIELRLDNGTTAFDHVVLATGYRVDIGKLGVLTPEVLRQVDLRAGYPVLSPYFESSVPGLHFVGSTAVGSFGPLPRFVAGAGFAARRVTAAAVAGALKPRAQAAGRPAMQAP